MKFKSILLFLGGFITFCLAVIAALFAALDKIDPAGNGPYVGPILTWAAISALCGTLAAALSQAKHKGGLNTEATPGWTIGLMAMVVLPGIVLTWMALQLGLFLSIPADRLSGSRWWHGLGFTQVSFDRTASDVAKAKTAAEEAAKLQGAKWRWDSVVRSANGTFEISAFDETSKRQWHFSVDASTGRVDRAEASAAAAAVAVSVNVLDLQKALQSQGSSPGPLDGKFGPRTLRALKAFQQGNNLAPSGLADPATLAKLGIGAGG